jgi:ATP-GRASP peptide maturase of grasp-with-spasm system
LSNYQELIECKLRSKNNINTPSDNELNKMNVYLVCKEIDILFPATWIGNNLSENPFIVDISKKNFLTKSLSYPNLIIDYKHNRIQFYSTSILINNEKLNEKHPEKFFPSLFQEYVEKKYEIRTFYLKGVFKSMAIFSQQNEKTKIDFRNYDYERPNRCVPYKLPKSLEKKLHKLMLKLDINCGSMDILVTPDDEYYFLEVNPIGQFQWLSHECNYFIERMIAKDLSN